MSKASDDKREDGVISTKRIINLKQNTAVKLEDFKDDMQYWHEFFVARADLSEPYRLAVINELGKLVTVTNEEQKVIDALVTQLKTTLVGE